MEATMTFKQQSEQWLAWSQTRDRKRLRATSVPSIQSALDKWILPAIGDLPLSSIHNGTVKILVKKMKDGGLSPKTIQTYLGYVKVIVSSLLDDVTGEPVYNRKWNSVILDTPEIKTQKQPCLEAAEIESMLINEEQPWANVLFTLLAATGLRISEALALETRHIVNHGRTLIVDQQVSRFGGIVDYTKTPAGIRQVDLAPEITDTLVTYARGKNGLLFPSSKGTPRLAGNVEKRTLAAHTDKGFHAFRRFRNTHLREVSAQPDLLIWWMGHKPESMTELYSKISKNLPARLAEAERVGTGFRQIDEVIEAAAD